MRVSTLVKYIFIIFAIVIIIYAGYKIYDRNNNQNNEVQISENESEEIIKDIRLAICNYDSINPLISNNREILNIDTLIFEPLFVITEDYQLEPCLGTEWAKTGDNTYVVKVDTTIKWQDGSYITAKDVQFTIDRLKEGNSIYKANVANITEVEVLDSSTIKITLDKEVAFFEYNLTFPIMSNMQYYNEDFYSSSKVPMGTGRFKITDISSTSISISKNEKWKRVGEEETRIDTIKINVYSSMGEVFNSFKLGNADFINTKTLNYQDYIGTIGFNITESAGREFDFIAFNCADEILQDKYVRQAINYAIDKDNIISSVYNNQKMTADYPLDYGNYLYSVENASSGYNAEQAKKILEENGWTYSNNKWKKKINGENKILKLKISVNQLNENRYNVAQIIKQQLENIGISVTINKISDEQYQEALNNRNYQMLITGVYNSYSPELSYFFGENNIFNYANEEMLSIINSGISSKNINGLKENYSKMFSIYKDEVPFVGLYRNRNITITNKSLIGEISTNNYTSFYNIETWYRK